MFKFLFFFLLYVDLTQDICKEINDNNDDKLCTKRICDVCEVHEVKDKSSYIYTCFSTSELENEMIQNFKMCGKYNSGLNINKVFEYFWDQQIKLSAIATVKDVSFDSVYNQVWKPTISKCLSLFKGKTVTLEEIEKLYQIHSFSTQLSILCASLHTCYPKSLESLHLPDEWVTQTVEHIALYYNEIANNPKCGEATNVILKVQTSLKLEGDFKIIECLANHVRL